jgi:L-seryl-tRNA(Ser) seleniumtransferase
MRDLSSRHPDWPEWITREAAREAVAAAREAVQVAAQEGEIAEQRSVSERADELGRILARPSPVPVVNATGVVLHTNLGRSVLAPEAARAAELVGSAYSDLELDLESGSRGSRLSGIDTLLRVVSGAPAGMVVNNNAAALLLALSALARGKEVVVSRGELVEIGGSFRVPDIMNQAGVRLVEVGTTNRTHARDYEAAIGPQTGVLLKVHRSNFAQSGFVAEVGLSELVEIGRAQGIPVIDDLGSGTFVDLRENGLPEDSYVPTRLAAGADLVCFSGDKLLGGPQAGILLGSAERIAELKRHPLARALRMGKLALAALDVTLRQLAAGEANALPTVRQLREPLGDVEARARCLAERLVKVIPPTHTCEVIETRAPVGGGSLPGFELPSHAVAVSGPTSSSELAASLRAAIIPVIARIDGDRVLLDAKTLLPGDDDAIEQALLASSVD